jgi:hypothetical protein
VTIILVAAFAELAGATSFFPCDEQAPPIVCVRRPTRPTTVSVVEVLWFW